MDSGLSASFDGIGRYARGLLGARICDERELAERRAAEGRRHAAGYSWRSTAGLTWDVYESVA
jgi:hypothetical protein